MTINPKFRDIWNASYHVTMKDGSVWAVPVRRIAEHRAAWYAHHEEDFEASLNGDTLPLFASDEFEIEDWASNNMNWSDVKALATQVQEPDVDYQDGWVNGEHSIVRAKEPQA